MDVTSWGGDPPVSAGLFPVSFLLLTLQKCELLLILLLGAGLPALRVVVALGWLAAILATVVAVSIPVARVTPVAGEAPVARWFCCRAGGITI